MQKNTLKIFSIPIIAFIWLLVLACPPSLVAVEMTLQEMIKAAGELEVGMDGRARYEAWDGLERLADQDSNSYDFASYRIRPYIGYPWDNLKLFSKFQAAGALDLPDDATSSPGLSYYYWSAPGDDPNTTDIIELYLEAKNIVVPGFGFRMGRQGIKDGAEVTNPVKIV